MTKARDLSNLISTGVPNSLITLDANEIPNLAASKITSGTFADARIAASNVSQHATSFDDNKIVNDISTLAIRQASNENKGAYNTNSMFVDVFQDATGISNLTNSFRNSSEYVNTMDGVPEPTNTVFYLKGDQADQSTTFTDTKGNFTLATSGTVQHRNNYAKVGSTAIKKSSGGYLSANNNSRFLFGTGEFNIEFWYLSSNATTSSHRVLMSQGGWGTNADQSGTSFFLDSAQKLSMYSSTANSGTGNGSHGGWDIGVQTNTSFSTNTWYHLCCSRGSDGKIRLFIDGVEQSYVSTVGQTGNEAFSTSTSHDFRIGISGDGSSASAPEFWLDNIIIAKGTGSGRTSNFTPSTVEFGQTANATGNFTSNAITASSSVNKMGAIVTYENTSGTNTLNTDIILQLSADNGSNFTTATLTAMPDFSTGIKMAKVNDLSVTAGTQLKYKISFANQASGSKEARIRGVSLQY